MSTATAVDLNHNPLFTTKEAAKYLQLSPKTLEAWRLSGKHGDDLPYVKIGRLVKYRKSTLDAFLERSERTHT